MKFINLSSLQEETGIYPEKTVVRLYRFTRFTFSFRMRLNHHYRARWSSTFTSTVINLFSPSTSSILCQRRLPQPHRFVEIMFYSSLLSFSLIGERISQQAIAQLIGDPRYLRFNVLIREDAKV
jgi:hypothetical protein